MVLFPPSSPPPPLHVPPTLSRPPSELVMVGVMTARKYLATRACSAWRAWAKDLANLGGQVKFFVGEKGDGEDPDLVDDVWCDLPVVVLEGVQDDKYPPQKKSFLMLRWMATHLGYRFGWFVRADDDVFIRTDKLVAFLGSLNHSSVSYIGQAGRGRGLEEGRLALDWDQNFCMGGPGVVLSRAALLQLAPHIKQCLNNLQTNHEDVEVGRCVRSMISTSCTWAYDMQSSFYHSTSSSTVSGIEVAPNAVSDRVLEAAITLHPLKQPKNMENMAARILQTKHRLASSRALRARGDAAKINKLFVDKAGSVSGTHRDLTMLENLDEFPVDTLESGSWDLVLNHHLYTIKEPGAKRRVPAHLAEGLTKAVAFVLDSINAEASEKGRIIEFRDLYYAYVNSHPSMGVTYILDLLLLYKRYTGTRLTVKVRRHVYLRQPFLEPQVTILPDTQGEGSPVELIQEDTGVAEADQRKEVVFVVAIAGEGRLPALRRFLDHYEREVLSVLQPARLVLVVFTGGQGGSGTGTGTGVVEATVREGMEELENQYPGYTFTIKLMEGSFSRGVGLMAGARLCPPDSLLLLLDVDILVETKALDTVRNIVRQGETVYFPIVYSQFRDGGGYWRDFGFGVVALYLSDLDSVGGLATNISGWGKEDVDLYDRFLPTNLTLWRSEEPGMIHLYHPVTCSKDLAVDQAAMCTTSRANTFLPTNTLLDIVLNSSLLQQSSFSKGFL